MKICINSLILEFKIIVFNIIILLDGVVYGSFGLVFKCKECYELLNVIFVEFVVLKVSYFEF